MAFHAIVAFGLGCDFLLKSISTYCDVPIDFKSSGCLCNQTCSGISDRVGYFFAQQSHCGIRDHKSGGSSPKSEREEKVLPFLPCDGVPGSNATLNKCGHCYTDPKESRYFINNCGTCQDEPCCNEDQKNECGQCYNQQCK